jgi:hypothetical protein
MIGILSFIQVKQREQDAFDSHNYDTTKRPKKSEVVSAITAKFKLGSNQA